MPSEGDDQPSTLSYVENDKSIRKWRAEANLGETDDFHVLTGDLRGDGRPLWIVANHEFSSQGIGVQFWSLHVLDPANPGNPPIFWSVSDFGPGSFARPRNPHRKGCDILVTDWVEGREPRRGGGLYFVGKWFRLGRKDIEGHATRRPRVRRYLYSFEAERAISQDDGDLQRYQGSPAQWLRPGKAIPLTAKILLPE